MRRRALDERADGFGVDDGVVVEDPDEFCAVLERVAHSHVVAARVAEIALVLDDLDPWMHFLHLGPAGFARPVVHDDDVEVAVRRFPETVETRERVGRAVPIEHDGEDFGLVRAVFGTRIDRRHVESARS
jgi:hypothetical protein